MSQNEAIYDIGHEKHLNQKLRSGKYIVGIVI